MPAGAGSPPSVGWDAGDPRLCRRVRNQALRLRLAQLCLGAGSSNTAKKKRSIHASVRQYSPGPKGKAFSFRSCGVFLPPCAAMRSPSGGFVAQSLGCCHRPAGKAERLAQLSTRPIWSRGRGTALHSTPAVGGGCGQALKIRHPSWWHFFKPKPRAAAPPPSRAGLLAAGTVPRKNEARQRCKGGEQMWHSCSGGAPKPFNPPGICGVPLGEEHSSLRAAEPAGTAPGDAPAPCPRLSPLDAHLSPGCWHSREKLFKTQHPPPSPLFHSSDLLPAPCPCQICPESLPGGRMPVGT